METFKEGDSVQVLDREDGLYWDAVIKRLVGQDAVRLWIPLCKLELTYDINDIRKPVEERPIQRISLFKRSELRLLVRKRKVVYRDGDKQISSEVKVNDPFEAFLKLSNGEEIPYERIVQIKEQTEDEDEFSDLDDEPRRKKEPFEKNLFLTKKRMRSWEPATNRKKSMARSQSTDRATEKALQKSKESIANHQINLDTNLNQNIDRGTPFVKLSKMNGPVSNEKEHFEPVRTETQKDQAQENCDHSPDKVTKDIGISLENHEAVQPAEEQHQVPTPPQPSIEEEPLKIPDNITNQITENIPITGSQSGDVLVMNGDFEVAPASASFLVSNSTMCASTANMFTPSSSPAPYQFSPSKAIPNIPSNLSFLPALSNGSLNYQTFSVANGPSNSLNYLPFSMPETLSSQSTQNGNNNLGDLSFNHQSAKSSDLEEKLFFEAKEQTVLLRRIMEGQQLMISQLGTVVELLSNPLS